jgi:hypothetical protein
MSNNENVVKLGSVAAVALDRDADEAARDHVGTDAQVHSSAEVWRVFQGPGSNGYIVCPTGGVAQGQWEAKLGDRRTWESADAIHPLCIIIKPSGDGPSIGPIVAGTMYLRQGTHSLKVAGIDKLLKQLATINWKQDKQRWVARLPKNEWMIVEHP